MHFPDNEKWRQEYYLKVSSQVALSEQQFPMLVRLNLESLRQISDTIDKNINISKPFQVTNLFFCILLETILE